jgi:hypothetical protein
LRAASSSAAFFFAASSSCEPIPDYHITGFSGKQWNDGKALNALIDALSPGTRVRGCVRVRIPSL